MSNTTTPLTSNQSPKPIKPTSPPQPTEAPSSSAPSSSHLQRQGLSSKNVKLPTQERRRSKEINLERSPIKTTTQNKEQSNSLQRQSSGSSVSSKKDERERQRSKDSSSSQDGRPSSGSKKNKSNLLVKTNSKTGSKSNIVGDVDTTNDGADDDNDDDDITPNIKNKSPNNAFASKPLPTPKSKTPIKPKLKSSVPLRANSTKALDNADKDSNTTEFKLSGTSFRISSSYKPLGLVGKGSYGIVCSAMNVLSGRKVAVKKIKPMCGDCWDGKHTLRELRLMRLLSPFPNIINLVDLNVDLPTDSLFIIMELMDTDLHRIISSKQALGDEHLKVIAKQILLGVGAMHRMGVLHRDLKPGNILVGRDCQVRITDFGLARAFSVDSRSDGGGGNGGEGNNNDMEVDPAAAMTEYVVTRWYRPPELLLSPSTPYNNSLDLWSVGCIFAEMVIRKPLFPGRSYVHQVQVIIESIGLPPTAEMGFTPRKDAASFLSRQPKTLPLPWPELLTQKCNSDMMDLISKILVFNPWERLDCKGCLAHVFFVGCLKLPCDELSGDMIDNVVVKMRNVEDKIDFDFDQSGNEKIFDVEILKGLILGEVEIARKANVKRDVDSETVKALRAQMDDASAERMRVKALKKEHNDNIANMSKINSSQSSIIDNISMRRSSHSKMSPETIKSSRSELPHPITNTSHTPSAIEKFAMGILGSGKEVAETLKRKGNKMGISMGMSGVMGGKKKSAENLQAMLGSMRVSNSGGGGEARKYRSAVVERGEVGRPANILGSSSSTGLLQSGGCGYNGVARSELGAGQTIEEETAVAATVPVVVEKSITRRRLEEAVAADNDNDDDHVDGIAVVEASG